MSEHNCVDWDSCPNPAHRTPTLTNFLLARIAEDEAHWGDPRLVDPGPLERRVLAECEAKRRIVEAHIAWDAPMDLVLRLLASVYADHADYREEWKP